MAEIPRYRETFKRLLGFLSPYKASLAVSIVLAIGYQAGGIALVWVTKNVIDDALKPNDSHKLWLYVGAIVVIGLVRALLMYGRRMISGKQALSVEMRSEEHTSELQSRSDLVCRLLLEKKKT